MKSLFASILKKEYILLKRYIFNTIGEIIFFYCLFLFLFLGYTAIVSAGSNYGTSLEGIIVSYLLWVFCFKMYLEISNIIYYETIRGTLEKLYTSYFGFTNIAIYQINASFFIQVVYTSCLLLLVILTTGRTLNLEIHSIFFFTVFLLLGIAGIGFFVGGLTLVFKRISSYLDILQFVIAGLVVAPLDSLPQLKYLPASLGSYMLREVMVSGKSLLSFSASKIIFLIANSLFYLSLGIFIFKLCEEKAKKEGILGHY